MAMPAMMGFGANNPGSLGLAGSGTGAVSPIDFGSLANSVGLGGMNVSQIGSMMGLNPIGQMAFGMTAPSTLTQLLMNPAKANPAPSLTAPPAPAPASLAAPMPAQPFDTRSGDVNSESGGGGGGDVEIGGGM